MRRKSAVNSALNRRWVRSLTQQRSNTTAGNASLVDRLKITINCRAAKEWPRYMIAEIAGTLFLCFEIVAWCYRKLLHGRLNVNQTRTNKPMLNKCWNNYDCSYNFIFPLSLLSFCLSLIWACSWNKTIDWLTDWFSYFINSFLCSAVLPNCLTRELYQHCSVVMLVRQKSTTGAWLPLTVLERTCRTVCYTHSVRRMPTCISAPKNFVQVSSSVVLFALRVLKC